MAWKWILSPVSIASGQMVPALAITISVASGRTDIETARRQSRALAEKIAIPNASNAEQAHVINKTGTPNKARSNGPVQRMIRIAGKQQANAIGHIVKRSSLTLVVAMFSLRINSALIC
jgi:hypothetical protein